MAFPVLASINLSWDEFGAVSHNLHSNVTANEYQKSDALALSVVLLTGSQLGILRPRYGLQVCDRILRFLEGLPLNPKQIQYPLSGARIDLHQKHETVVCTFHPKYVAAGTMEPEEAVARLLGNLPLHLSGIEMGEIVRFFKAGLQIVVSCYLSEGLPGGISRGIFSRRRFKQQNVQFVMLSFNELIYPYWSRGLNIPKVKFEERLTEARANYRKLVSEF